MNKKLKIFLALTLVIQLLVPSSLLIYQYSLLNTVKNLETEYTFEISSLSFDDYYVYEDSFSEISEGPLSFLLAEDWRVSADKVTPVLSPQNNVLMLEKLKDGDKTDVWFYNRYYYRNRSIEPEFFSFVNEEDKGELKRDLRNEYSHFKGDEKDFEHAYLTAKIYKGVFLPTAIYFRGEKIISIEL